MKLGTIIALIILFWPAIQAILAKVAERKLKEKREEEAAKRRTMEVPRDAAVTTGTAPREAQTKPTAAQRREAIIARRKAQMDVRPKSGRAPASVAAPTSVDPRRQQGKPGPTSSPQSRRTSEAPVRPAPRGPGGGRTIAALGSPPGARPGDFQSVPSSPPSPELRHPFPAASSAASQTSADALNQVLASGPRAMRNWIVMKEILDPPVSIR
jgi:hypothetical protein